MNYVVYDDEYYDDYDHEIKNKSKKKKFNFKKFKLSHKTFKIITIIIVILIIIVTFGILNKYNVFDFLMTYSDLEKRMVESAEQFVLDNNLVSSNSIYLTSDKLNNVKLKKKCSELSGVIVENGNYYPYLICDNYKSNVINNNEKYAKLNGDEVIILYKGYDYKDLGCKSNYTIQKTDNYANREGVYNIKYNVMNNNMTLSTLNRKVIVIDNKYKDNFPKLKLNGSSVIFLEKNRKYNELGYTASDQVDGDINKDVKISNNIDNTRMGEYKVNYSVINSKGYMTNIQRSVVVVNNLRDLYIHTSINPSNDVNSNVVITLSINGTAYNKTILPNNQTTTNSVINYPVSENGTYNFKIYDNTGKVSIKTINIDNIDKKLPTATCKATTYNDYTQIIVSDVSENSCVYRYKIDKYSSEYVSSILYLNSIGNAGKVSVELQDKAGNINNINCTLDRQITTGSLNASKEYINEKGYNCLTPYTCFKQGDYKSEKYKFCSTETCGTISRKGCSITSVSTIISRYSMRSKNGKLYTPYTLLTEVYNKLCSKSCSGPNTSKKVFEHLGLEVVGDTHFRLNNDNYNLLLNHLRSGNPALIRVEKGWYASAGHLMALLGANNKNQVFLSDPDTKNGTINRFRHKTNTYIPLSDVIKGCGSSCWFMMVKEK